ncbi:MAG: hypothetical protein Q8943_12195 [Bacteroidota bacterium]|nr:hypothetical protein [Bacteroidota bacterium]
MKTIALIFLCLTAFLTMEPLLSAKGLFIDHAMIGATRSPGSATPIHRLVGMAMLRAPAGMHCCKKKMHCSGRPEPKDGKNDCPGSGCQGTACNPFMACAYGNFYLPAKSGAGLVAPSLSVEKRFPENDNRLSSRLSESWHPPEAFAV